MTRILCVEQDPTIRETRCAILNGSGYDAAPAAPQLAESMIRAQDFDLLVLPRLNSSLIGLAEGADVLVLDRFTMPLELLWLVSERLSRKQRA
jgi:CheY-like chemotaxis protein